jgi:hypothetical protein
MGVPKLWVTGMFSGMNRTRSLPNAIINQYIVVLPREGVCGHTRILSFTPVYTFESTVPDVVNANIGPSTGLTVNIHTSSRIGSPTG